MTTTRKTPATVTDITAATGKPKRASRASKSAARNATDAQKGASLDALLTGQPAPEIVEPTPEPAPEPVVEAAPAITDALTVLLVDGDFEVHKTGCRDIARARKARKIANEFGLPGEWSDPDKIAEELWADQIAEAGDDADLSTYHDATNVRPCTGLTGKARSKSATTRVLDDDAAAARAELLAERAKAAEAATGKAAIPAGYVIHWAYPAGHSRLARTSDAPEGSPKWLARCDEHGTTKPAAGAKEARSLGSRKVRVEWCAKCKSDAAKKAAAASKSTSASTSTSASASDAPAPASTSDASATASADDASKIDASDEHDAASKSE